MVYDMTCRAWNGIWYDLTGIVQYIIRPGGNDMLYGMTWKACHGL